MVVQLGGRKIRPLLLPHWSQSSALLMKYCQVSEGYKSTFFSHGAAAPSGPGLPHFGGFTITLRHTTLGRTPLDERSDRLRDLYLTAHYINKRETSMAPAGFEPAIPASERSQTHALDRKVTVTGYEGI